MIADCAGQEVDPRKGWGSNIGPLSFCKECESTFGPLTQRRNNIDTEEADAARRSVVEIQKLLRDPIASDAHTTLGKNVPSDMTIFADARLLGLVVQNLISNAIKFYAWRRGHSWGAVPRRRRHRAMLGSGYRRRH
jgi:light-regulated signal transduction histidine kinase (bacteriophytochrome)